MDLAGQGGCLHIYGRRCPRGWGAGLVLSKGVPPLSAGTLSCEDAQSHSSPVAEMLARKNQEKYSTEFQQCLATFVK